MGTELVTQQTVAVDTRQALECSLWFDEALEELRKTEKSIKDYIASVEQLGIEILEMKLSMYLNSVALTRNGFINKIKEMK